MKKAAGIILAGMFALALPVSALGAKAEGEETQEYETVNLFEDESAWKHNKTGSNNAESVKFEDGVLKVTPQYVVGSTYCAKAMGQGRISFTYQLTYPDGSVEDTEDGLADWVSFVENNDFFFGVLFGNSPINVRPSESLAVPFNEGAGGFPYMVAFDSEKQNNGHDPVREEQLGLTLRRYKAAGSHDFTRWSSVEPTDAIYINGNDAEYESKMPDFNKAVTIADCFDFEEHKVDIDVKNLYKEKGDALDAVQIEIYFDDELSLRVIDEMPFEHDLYDETIDKRERDGWISTYAYGGSSMPGGYEDFTVNFKTFTAQFRESNGATGGEPDGKGKGCSSQTVAGTLALSLGVFAAACGAIVLAAKKKHNED